MVATIATAALFVQPLYIFMPFIHFCPLPSSCFLVTLAQWSSECPLLTGQYPPINESYKVFASFRYQLVMFSLHSRLSKVTGALMNELEAMVA